MAKGAAAVEEQDDGTQDQEDQETDDTESKSQDDADGDNGAEGEEDGEAVGEDGGEGEAAEGKDDGKGDADKGVLAVVKGLMDRLDKMEGKGGGSEEADSEGVESILIPAFSEQQTAKLEEQFGVSGKQVALMRNMVNSVAQRLFNHFGSKVGGLSAGSAIDALANDPSGKYKDISKYRTGINEFLGKFSPKDRSNKELIVMGLTYARGLDKDKAVKAAANGHEANRRIAVGGRPAAPAGGGKDKGQKPLTAEQRQAMKAAGMGETEYRKYLAKSTRRIR